VSKEHSGFTLIEVLIAMAVIGVGLIALVTLFPVALESSRLAGDFTTASFVAQQALDDIRAAAQVYDPGDLTDEDGDGDRFDDPNGNGLGYYELPISATKGTLSDAVYFPNSPQQPQWWKIWFDPALPVGQFRVISSIYGVQTNVGFVEAIYQSDKKDIRFFLDETGGYEYGDELTIHIEMHAGNPYYWHAKRAPVTEDVNLNGSLDGDEDTGLDLIPDYWDRNNNGSYEAGLDVVGETGFTGTNDPHGDNRVVPLGSANVVNPYGTEGNGVIDAFDDDDIQKVTVIVGWREGGKDRVASFSTAIPNQFR